MFATRPDSLNSIQGPTVRLPVCACSLSYVVNTSFILVNSLSPHSTKGLSLLLEDGALDPRTVTLG